MWGESAKVVSFESNSFWKLAIFGDLEKHPAVGVGVVIFEVNSF